ncbi:MAG: Ig-like domain-containing protein [Bacteroidales bacterium]|nr:Ig-like domain-containing protein [Bacteroidales bacterium]
MKRALIVIIYIFISLANYGQIIADHTVVDKFNDIPQEYINEVKKMMIAFMGESHSEALRTGLELLEAMYPEYACNIATGEEYTDQYLRADDYGWIGEDTWFTWYAHEEGSRPYPARAEVKNAITSYNNDGHPFSALGFGWCGDMVIDYGASSSEDPVYGVHWYGASFGGPDGNACWGLDEDDYAITGNRVNLETYFGAMEEYIAHCAANSPATKMIFTTGPVDYEGDYVGEAAYQGHIKHEAIRDYVNADPSRILFDYADILCYDDDGSLTTETWNGHVFPSITPTNETPRYVGHISEAGAIRLAKAQWWMLARIAGWDEGPSDIPVTSITVNGEGGSAIISTVNGTLQLYASILPQNATDKTVTWSISEGTGQATISSTGLVTAIANGTVTARATANDGSGVYGTLVITISNQFTPVESITVTGEGGATLINTLGGTLQLNAEILPIDATNKSVTWSVINGTGEATISAIGLLTAVANGKVKARATANDGTGVYGELEVTISNQVIPVESITVNGEGGANTITTDDGTLQLSVIVLPSDATDKTITWSIISNTGQATISSTGLVTAIKDGTVTARATANDGSGVSGTFIITISNQVIPVESITLIGEGGSSTIGENNGTLQLFANVLPSNATDKTVSWSIIDGTGQATISSTGLVTAVENGTVTARAIANDGSGVYGILVVTISNQVVLVESITVTGAGGSSSINTDNGTLQLSAAVLPSNATDKTVTWAIISGTGQASIDHTGLVTAITDGTVTARATAKDGSGVYGSLLITISNQFVQVESIIVSGAGGATLINILGGTLQLSAEIIPSYAFDHSVTWSIINGTGEATITSTGLVTAIDNGTVTARATANDGSGVYGELVITISNQVIPVTSIAVTGEGGFSLINTPNGTLQLNAAILPADATDKTVTWTIINGTGQAYINSSGLLAAAANGTVTAKATANDGSGVYGTLLITISNQFIPVESIAITGAGGSSSINTNRGTLQLNTVITPSNATNTTVTWSIIKGTGEATISPSGLVTATANGTVTARATANDGSGVYGNLDLTISNQVILVTSISISSDGGTNTINNDNGTLQLYVSILPGNASNKTVTWWISDITGQATISPSGLVRAIGNGTVRVVATANDGSGVYGIFNITISNQSIPITSISIFSEDGLTNITEENGTLQLSAVITPSNASNQTVAWSVINGTGQAIVSPTGLVTAISEGVVTVVATANDGSGVFSTLDITIEFIIYDDFRIIVHDNNIEILFSEDHTGYQLSLYDLMGKLKQKKIISGNSCYFNTATLPEGIYIIALSTAVIHNVRKVIISR